MSVQGDDTFGLRDARNRRENKQGARLTLHPPLPPPHKVLVYENWETLERKAKCALSFIEFHKMHFVLITTVQEDIKQRS